MREKTKKEHYVPRCYLDRWGNNKGQVVVYDKKIKSSRVNRIYDVACERYYYDIDYKELSAKSLKLLKELKMAPEQDEQFMEHFLSEQVEDIYSRLLKKILDKEITPWYENNCYFLSETDKLLFSVCIAFQYIRTKEVRRMISDASNCLEQAFQAMNAPDEMFHKYLIKTGQDKKIQGDMLLDAEQICHLTESFYKLTWILGVNRTTNLFYTSDNPIGKRAHVDHPYMTMTGIRSEGVEVFFPLSPKHILFMYDGTFHKQLAPYDRRYVSIDEIEMVENYNWYSTLGSTRCVYSRDGNFAVIDEMLKRDSTVFDLPKMQLSWGGQKFVPKQEK